MKRLKKPLIMIILTLICVILIDNYKRTQDELKLKEQQTNEAEQPTATKEEAPSYAVTFLALGQNLMNDSTIHSGQKEEGVSYDFLFQDVKEFVEEADISAICQGSVIGGNALGVSGYPTFNAPEEFCDSAILAGIDVVAMANVRVNNMGSSAISTCINLWKSRLPEIQVLGIHDDKEEPDYQIIEKNGLKIALLDYTAIVTSPIGDEEAYKVDFFGDYTGGVSNLQELSESTKNTIREADEAADFVIVFASWGLEDTHEISQTQEVFAKQLTEQGVDLIIGNRPNYLQKVEWITADNGNRSLCYYSLGNFGSSETTADALLGGIAQVQIKLENGQTVIEEENTGLIPVVSYYTYSGTGNEVEVKSVMPFSKYTDEVAATHGLTTKSGLFVTSDVLWQILNQSVDTGFLLHR